MIGTYPRVMWKYSVNKTKILLVCRYICNPRGVCTKIPSPDHNKQPWAWVSEELPKSMVPCIVRIRSVLCVLPNRGLQDEASHRFR